MALTAFAFSIRIGCELSGIWLGSFSLGEGIIASDAAISLSKGG
jgi:hypothetical protein